MKKRETGKFLQTYVTGVRESFEHLGNEMLRLFDSTIDPTVPVDRIYTIKRRVKKPERLLEKIEKNNSSRPGSLTPENFHHKLDDILGIRVICLRLSDVVVIQKFVDYLIKEGKLVNIRKPRTKASFVLPINPREGIPRDIDLQYTGYSSIHYVVRLGIKKYRPPPELRWLRAEIQVRTILEEAWGEIDHKYNYEIRGSGGHLPESIRRGFYNFGAYLQAAGMQAEYLCRDVEELQSGGKAKRARSARTKTRAVETSPPVIEPAASIDEEVSGEELTLGAILGDIAGFEPTARTKNYLRRRIRRYRSIADLKDEVLRPSVVLDFEDVLIEELGRPPFINPSDRDIDLINLVNYGLARLERPRAIANAGLQEVLRNRM